jgi:tRNA-dihydrouridine synthase B
MRLRSVDLGRVFLAPLSGVSDSPFRRICKRFGADTVYTEMTSSEGLARGNLRTLNVMRFHASERPVGIQIFGRNHERMAAAARLAEEKGADFIDLNMSCPARKIVAKGVGCALLREPRTIGRIAEAVVAATSLPVTAKIRIGWDEGSMNGVEVAGILEAAGIAAICVHGRTWRQGFAGRSSWPHVAAVKRSVGVPVILSGDVTTPAAASSAFDVTGCDAVMVGRAVFGRPWIFEAIHSHFGGGSYVDPGPDRIGRVILDHLDLAIGDYGERAAVVRFRKHLLWYTRGMAGVVALRPAMSTVSSRLDVVGVLSRLAERAGPVEGGL